MRVLVVASELPPIVSGVSRSVGRLVDDLRAAGHQVDVESFVQHRRYSVGEFRVSAFPAELPRLFRGLDDYDVVNLHGPVPTMSDAFLTYARRSRRPRPPLVYTHHYSIEIDGFGAPGAVYNRWHERLAHVADRIVVTTPSYQKRLGAHGSTPVDVISWGVDASRFRATRPPRASDTPLRVLYLGQMRPYKGIGYLIDAVKASDGIRLSVAGDGKLRPSLEARSEGSDAVTFLGRPGDADLAALYAQHDIIALPSVNRLEAFGLVLLEGMAAGCVPVATDLEGLRDVAGPTGVVVPRRDASALRGALEALRDDPERLARLSTASVERAVSLDWANLVPAYELAFDRARGTARAEPRSVVPRDRRESA